MRDDRIVIERSFVQCLIGHNRWVWRAPEFAQDYQKLSPLARAKLSEIAKVFTAEFERRRAISPPRDYMEWICFTVAALNQSPLPNQWEQVSLVDIAPRLWIEIKNSDPIRPLMLYRNASPLLDCAFAQVADHHGIALPNGNDALGISKFLAKAVERPTGVSTAMYRSLTDASVDALVHLALSIDVSILGDRKDVVGTFLARLAVTGENRLSRYCREMYESPKPWPGIVYIHADEAFRNWLISDYINREEKGLSIDPSPLFWMFDDHIGSLIADGHLDLDSIDELPYEVLNCGFTIDVSGGITLHHLDAGYELVPLNAPDAKRSALAFARAESTQPFSRYLLDIDLTDETMAFLGMRGTRLRIPYMPRYEPVFWRIDLDGGCAAYDADIVADEYMESDWTDSPDALFGIGSKMATPFESAWPASLVSRHVGGLPTWEQDPAYPECPDCGERMTFIARASADGHSTAYACLCYGCEIAGVVCQCD